MRLPCLWFMVRRLMLVFALAGLMRTSGVWGKRRWRLSSGHACIAGSLSVPRGHLRET